MKEVFGIMNLLDPERYDDEEDFYENFGGDAETPTVEQVRALQVSTQAARHIKRLGVVACA